MFSCGLNMLLLMVCWFSVVVTGYHFHKTNGQYMNELCAKLEEVTDNSTCKYGAYEEKACGGKIACLAGSADKCDKPRSSFRHGQCANGLFCNNCGQCQGCLLIGSEKFCYENLLCGNSKPFLKRANNYPIFNDYYDN